jgi:Icc-related predicted phosphoesterase
MLIDCIADTHGRHKQLDLEGGDILIHAGDIEARNKASLVNFLGWFDEQPYTHKIFVAGNHDGWMEQHPGKTKYITNKYNSIYLQDEYVTINDIKIWGSPWALEFGGWAFMKTEQKMDEYVNKIPNDIDILISHGPAYGILDKETYGELCGSVNLHKPSPKYFVCGHIHEQGGRTKTIEETQYINASVVNRELTITNKQITIDYENK